MPKNRSPHCHSIHGANRQDDYSNAPDCTPGVDVRNWLTPTNRRPPPKISEDASGFSSPAGTAADRIKVTIGKYVSIDMAETQSAGRGGAGAELPRAIVIPAKKRACRVWLDPQ